MPERLILEANQSLALDSSATLWYLEQGTLLLFNEQIGSIKEFLFEINAGEYFIGSELAEDVWNFAAVASSVDCHLVSYNIDDWWIDQADTEKHKALSRWFDKISDFLQQNSPFPDREYVDLDLSQDVFSLVLEEGDILKADQISFSIDIEDGYLELFGEIDIVHDDSSGTIPVYFQTWFKAQSQTKLTVYVDPKEADIERFKQGLIASQLVLHDYLILREVREEERIRKKLQSKLSQDEGVLSDLLDNLSGLFIKESEKLLFSKNTPLLEVMGKIGRYLGVPILPANDSESEIQARNPLEGIVRASRLRMRRVSLTEQWWKNDNGPLLGYWKGQDPVALIPIANSKYEVYNPSDDSTYVVDAKLQENISGMAFMFYRTLPDGSLNIWDVLKFGFKSNVKDFILILLCVLAVQIIGMFTPILSGKLLNDVIPNHETSVLVQMGIFLLSADIGLVLFQLTQGYTTLKMESFSDIVIQSAIWDRVLQLPAQFFKSQSTGDFYSRVTGVTNIFHMLNGTVVNTILGGVFAIFNLALVAFYSPQLALLGIVVALVTIIITAIHSWLTLKVSGPMVDKSGQLQSRVFQLTKYVNKLRVTGSEKRAFAYWAQDYQQLTQFNLSLQNISQSLHIFNHAITTITTIAIFIVAYDSIRPSNPLIAPSLNVGNFFAANAAFGTFIGSIIGLSNTLLGLLSIVFIWRRVKPILTSPLEATKEKLDPGKLSGMITLDRVRFRYQANKPLVLNDVSLQVNPGEFIAIVGRSGCGKSTIIRLLLGFETPESGIIQYDFKNLQKINVQAVRRQLGVVLQNGKLQAGSIFDNIAGGALITQDDAWAAARLAGFDQDIAAMPMKMYTIVSEGGTNLSGGQRQRLLITKSLALKPKMLIFDEATSALDNHTQLIVTKSLEKLKVTRIVVAHRLSTIRSADRIYVIDQGRVAQVGNYAQLSQQEGLFVELMKNQMN